MSINRGCRVNVLDLLRRFARRSQAIRPKVRLFSPRPMTKPDLTVNW